jgi:acyl-CoA synthetase (NDP forming)
VSQIIAAASATPKAVGVVWTGAHASNDGLPKLQASNLPVFLLPSGAAQAMAALVRAGTRRPGPASVNADELPHPDAAAGLRARAAGLSGALSERTSKELLGSFGIAAPPEVLCPTPDEAIDAAEHIGYPVVLKGCGPGLVHKTELGLVRLDLRSGETLRAAASELLASAQAAGLPDFEGVLVQPFVRGGVEAIVGLSNDPQIGTLVMLGLGGTLVEAIGAVTWRCCPIDVGEADAMIDDVPALGTFLGGVRGAPAADRAALVRALVSLSDFGMALGDRLESVDVNPLLVLPDGEGALALDALVVLH